MNTAQILAAGIALVWLLVRLLKADTLNVVLASYGYGPIPKRVLPWIALFAGVTAAVLTEFQLQGITFPAFLAGLVEGLGIGAGATATQELGKGVPGVKKVLGVLVFVACAALGTSACTPPVAPRETARATVLVVADAVKQLDTACAAVVTATKNADLGIRCADGYDSARAALLGAEKAVDAYESAAAKDLPCAIALAVDSLGRMADAVRAAGGKLPAIVDDAFRLAPLLTVACRG